MIESEKLKKLKNEAGQVVPAAVRLNATISVEETYTDAAIVICCDLRLFYFTVLDDLFHGPDLWAHSRQQL